MVKRKAGGKVKPIMLRRKVVEPVRLVQLMDTIGPTRAAEQMGVSTTLVHKAKKDGGVNKVVELAAAHILEHLGDGGAPSRAAPRSLTAPPVLVETNPAAALMGMSAEQRAKLYQVAALLGLIPA